jgi:hypothetical protein
MGRVCVYLTGDHASCGSCVRLATTLRAGLVSRSRAAERVCVYLTGDHVSYGS